MSRIPAVVPLLLWGSTFVAAGLIFDGWKTRDSFVVFEFALMGATATSFACWLSRRLPAVEEAFDLGRWLQQCQDKARERLR